MENIVIIALLLAILFTVIVYIVKAKKKGIKCIGCPNKNCKGKCSQSKE